MTQILARVYDTIAAEQHLVLLYSGRNAHIFVRSRSHVLKSVSRLTTI